jgi:UDP-glucose 4-epimerase
VLGLERLVAGEPSEVFNLGNGKGFSVREVISTAERVTGRRIRAIAGPRRPGDPHTLVGSSDKARRVLGWTPRLASLETIVETAWAWHRAGGDAPAGGGHAGPRNGGERARRRP